MIYVCSIVSLDKLSSTCLGYYCWLRFNGNDISTLGTFAKWKYAHGTLK